MECNLRDGSIGVSIKKCAKNTFSNQITHYFTSIKTYACMYINITPVKSLSILLGDQILSVHRTAPFGTPPHRESIKTTKMFVTI